MNLSADALRALSALAQAGLLLWFSQRDRWAADAAADGFEDAFVQELLEAQLARWSLNERRAVYLRPAGVLVAVDRGLVARERAEELLQALDGGGAS